MYVILDFAVMVGAATLALITLVVARDKQSVASALLAIAFYIVAVPVILCLVAFSLWTVGDQQVTALTATMTMGAGVFLGLGVGFYLWCLALVVSVAMILASRAALGRQVRGWITAWVLFLGTVALVIGLLYRAGSGPCNSDSCALEAVDIALTLFIPLVVLVALVMVISTWVQLAWDKDLRPLLPPLLFLAVAGAVVEDIVTVWRGPGAWGQNAGFDTVVAEVLIGAAVFGVAYRRAAH